MQHNHLVFGFRRERTRILIELFIETVYGKYLVIVNTKKAFFCTAIHWQRANNIVKNVYIGLKSKHCKVVCIIFFTRINCNTVCSNMESQMDNFLERQRIAEEQRRLAISIQDLRLKQGNCHKFLLCFMQQKRDFSFRFRWSDNCLQNFKLIYHIYIKFSVHATIGTEFPDGGEANGK